MALKLNVLLAKTDHLAAAFKNNIKDFLKFFKEKQGQFKGEKKTYTPREGVIDDPGKRGTVRVVTTVDEKLKWLEENQAEYVNSLFALEKTNSSGIAKTQLKVGDVDFGELTSLELLRLKSLLEAGDLKEMYESIPTRSDAEIWAQANNDDYSGRDGIYQTPLVSGVVKTTQKESFIITDPNVEHLRDTSKYVPQISTKDTVLELGDYTHQKFSGEYSHLQRANILKRRHDLLTAVVAALKVANDVEQQVSDLTAEKLFNYLHRGA